MTSVWLATAPEARADLINIQFGSDDTISGPTSQYTGAGVLGTAGDQWNMVGGAFNSAPSKSSIPLADASGAATSISLSYSGGTGFYDASGPGGIFTGSPLQNLMTSYLYTYGTATVTLSGLIAGDTYELVLYSASNTAGRSTSFTVDGTTETATETNTQTLTLGDNYEEFVAPADASGDLMFTFTGPGDGEGDLDGIQLSSTTASPVPEPSSIAILATGLAAIWPLSRRRRRNPPV